TPPTRTNAADEDATTGSPVVASSCARLPAHERRHALPGELAGPAAAEVVGGGLRLAVAGEDALLVASDPHDAGGRGEVGEVPDLLADDGLAGVEDAVVHLEVLHLVLLRPRGRRELVQARHGVGAILGDDDRLAVARPALELLCPGEL